MKDGVRNEVFIPSVFEYSVKGGVREVLGV